MTSIKYIIKNIELFNDLVERVTNIKTIRHTICSLLINILKNNNIHVKELCNIPKKIDEIFILKIKVVCYYNKNYTKFQNSPDRMRVE